MKIEFYNKETGEPAVSQEDFKIDYEGTVYEDGWSHGEWVSMTNSNIGWRVVNA
jgi:hypothetical protein